MPVHSDSPTFDIIGKEPSWLVSSGIGLAATISTILIGLTWFIHYPNSLSAPVTLQRVQSIVKHGAQMDGTVKTILVKDGAEVKKGQPLAILESTADYAGIDQLYRLLTSEEHANQPDLMAQKIPQLAIYQLGEIQDEFSQLSALLDSWRQAKKDNNLNHKRKSFHILSERYSLLISGLLKKHEHLAQKAALSEEEVVMQQRLEEKGLLVNSELVQAKQRHLNQLSLLSGNQVEIDSYKMKLTELEIALSRAALEQEQFLETKEAEIFRKRTALLNRIVQWQSRYIVSSKIDGRISYHQDLRTYQQVKRKQPLFSVTPSDQRMDGWMKVQGKGIGNIRPGQSVYIELDSFFTTEFGILEAKVASFNLIPDEHGYLVKLSLPDKIVTSYGKSLLGYPYLTGKGKIIFSSKRLLTRIAESIFSPVSKI